VSSGPPLDLAQAERLYLLANSSFTLFRCHRFRSVPKKGAWKYEYKRGNKKHMSEWPGALAHQLAPLKLEH